MRSSCAERDYLWKKYDLALREYISAVEEMLYLGGWDFAGQAADARGFVRDVRLAIVEHCRGCGCDPEWVRLIEARGLHVRDDRDVECIPYSPLTGDATIRTEAAEHETQSAMVGAWG